MATSTAAGPKSPTRSPTRRSAFALLVVYSVAYFAVTCLLASRKAVWYDEIFTMRLAELPTLGDLWSALKAGVDLNPPLGYLATRAAFALFGEGPVGLRLPAIVGFWVMTLCLYRFVARDAGRWYAAIALLFPFATCAHHIYALEGRPYGPVLGCCGLILVCWQAAARGGGWAARIGLAVSLAAAVSLHFYAALLIVPPAIGELVRMVRRRRADWFTGLALVAGLAPLALYWPIIRTARSDYAAAFWSRATLESFPIFYKYLLEADLLPWIAALAVLAIFPATRALRSGGPVADVPTPVPEDVAVAAALALLPGLAVGLALLLGTAYTERYVVYAVVGLAILAATVLHQYGRGSPLLATVILAVLVGWLGPKMAQKYRRFEEARSEIVKLPEKLLEAADPKSPLVVANPLLYLRLTYYGPPELTERIVYVASPAHARRYLGFDTNDRALLALREWTPLRVVPLEDFTSSHPRFQIYESGAPEWLQTELAAKGARLDKAKHGMVNVTLPAKSASPPNP